MVLKLHFGTPVDFFCESIHIIEKAANSLLFF